MESFVDRDGAWSLFTEYTESSALIRHALAVEAAMRAYAGRFGGDQELWGNVGLLHDFDYDRWPEPENHPEKGAKILRVAGYSEELIYAIRAHATYLGLERRSPMDRALFAVDELCGFISAVALVRPSRSVLDVKVSSVRKKWKQRSFAEGVKREDIELGARELGIELDEHIGFVLTALQAGAAQIGLAGADVITEVAPG
jgi:putative nucleotidyltransferase with HDIG domain